MTEWTPVTDKIAKRRLINSVEYRITTKSQYDENGVPLSAAWQQVNSFYRCQLCGFAVDWGLSFMDGFRFVHNAKWIRVKPIQFEVLKDTDFSLIRTFVMRHSGFQATATVLDYSLNSGLVNYRIIAGRNGVRSVVTFPNPTTIWNQIGNTTEANYLAVVFEITSNVDDINSFNVPCLTDFPGRCRIGQLVFVPWNMIRPVGKPGAGLIVVWPRNPADMSKLRVAFLIDGAYFKIAKDENVALVVDPVITLYSDPADGYIKREKIGLLPITYTGYTEPCAVGYWVWVKGVDPDPPVPTDP